MPTLYIVRGLPGSGKSTFARELQAKTGALFVEPDMFLMSDGVYRYTEARYSTAITEAVDCIYAASRRNADVIFADVLPSKQEIQALINMLLRRGDEYQIKVFTMKITAAESQKRNVHNVRHEDIDRMAREWEDWPGEQVINGMVRNETEGTEKTEEMSKIFMCGECGFNRNEMCNFCRIPRNQKDPLCTNFKTKDGKIPRYCRMAQDIDRMAEEMLFMGYDKAGCEGWVFRDKLYFDKDKAIEAAKSWLMECEDEK